MKKFLQQLFCEHIWKEDKVEFLRRMAVIVQDPFLNSHTVIAIKNYQAVHNVCIKCGKKQVKEQVSLDE